MNQLRTGKWICFAFNELKTNVTASLKDCDKSSGVFFVFFTGSENATVLQIEIELICSKKLNALMLNLIFISVN